MKIYIAGVGVGMGPIAFMARDMGHEVVCSDLVEHDLVEYMRDNGFTVHIGQDGTDIAQEHASKPIDWFIHTAALPYNHPELKHAQDQGIKTSKRDDFITMLIHEKNLKMIAIAGTHGKTNTTGMVTWVLQKMNIPVSYSIGARISFGHFGAYQEGSEYFVYEADEFDRNMLHFSPDVSVITNISFDHPDSYLDQLDYDEAFAQFIDQSRVTYMYESDISVDDGSNVKVFKKTESDLDVKLPGTHIRQNARLIVEMLVAEFNLDKNEVIKHINSYPGTSRRMERLKENLYTDYAHHPEEIEATIQAVKELSESVVVVYQPHQNIRQHEILDGYGGCFDEATKVYWLPTYLSREKDLPILKPEEIIANIPNNKHIEIVDMSDDLATKIADHLQNGQLVIGMSAGDLDHWLRNL